MLFDIIHLELACIVKLSYHYSDSDRYIVKIDSVTISASVLCIIDNKTL